MTDPNLTRGDTMTDTTDHRLTDSEREVIRIKAAQSGIDSVILYVERLVAVADQRGRDEAWDQGYLSGSLGDAAKTKRNPYRAEASR